MEGGKAKRTWKIVEIRKPAHNTTNLEPRKKLHRMMIRISTVPLPPELLAKHSMLLAVQKKLKDNVHSLLLLENPLKVV